MCLLGYSFDSFGGFVDCFPSGKGVAPNELASFQPLLESETEQSV